MSMEANKGYKFSEYGKARDDFKRYIKCEVQQLYDPILSWVAGKIVFDIVKFERFLEKEGMRDDESIHDFVLTKYGEEALFIVNKLFMI